ncbi:MAG: hypothetical protein R3272_11955, partial [Candidatus Promineifilaceae bacterium]|nr:hypothetical protein [Candidatus Promineifilaceae bacterium]
MNFDWQSEDADWNEPPPTASGPTRRPLWRRALVPLALLLVLVAFAFFLSREARERVIEAEEQTTEDLLASVALVHQAANPAAGDGELLRVLLSGRDAAWAESQSALADAGRLFAGAAGALGMAP